MKRPILELVNAGKYFNDNFSLESISLTLHAGEVHVIVGENGSGKSAIMKIVSGIFARDTGEILLDGEPVSFGSVHESKANGIIHQLQEPMLFDNLTVAENIFFDRQPRKAGLLKPLHRTKLLNDCRALFAELGIAIDPEAPAWKLGFAERQLIDAAKTYVSDSRVVIMDEPSASMSEPEREVLFFIVNALKDRGAGVFYISHRFDEIKRLGDRVSIVHQGRVVDTLKIASLENDTLFRIMTGQIRTERYPRIEVSAGPEVMRVRGLRSGRVLKDVSFSLRKGEILGITGLMGSGRTLLAHCLFGVIQPDGGSITISGEEVRFSGPGDALRHGIGMIPEDRAQNAMFHRHNLTNNMTIAALERFVHGVTTDTRFMHRLVHDYVRRLHIRPGFANDLIESYSGGNQQKVMVARWLMRRSRIYIMDEPTRGIDVASKIDIYNAMNDLVTHGASIILISSEIEEILGLCDRIMVLAGGRMVCDLPRSVATKERILELATNDA
jgi:ribose transport system ATP-binding protein